VCRGNLEPPGPAGVSRRSGHLVCPEEPNHAHSRDRPNFVDDIHTELPSRRRDAQVSGSGGHTATRGRLAGLFEPRTRGRRSSGTGRARRPPRPVFAVESSIPVWVSSSVTRRRWSDVSHSKAVVRRQSLEGGGPTSVTRRRRDWTAGRGRRRRPGVRTRRDRGCRRHRFPLRGRGRAPVPGFPGRSPS